MNLCRQVLKSQKGTAKHKVMLFGPKSLGHVKNKWGQNSYRIWSHGSQQNTQLRSCYELIDSSGSASTFALRCSQPKTEHSQAVNSGLFLRAVGPHQWVTSSRASHQPSRPFLGLCCSLKCYLLSLLPSHQNFITAHSGAAQQDSGEGKPC